MRGDELGLGVVGSGGPVRIERPPAAPHPDAGEPVEVLLGDEAREGVAVLVERVVATSEPEEALPRSRCE